MGAPWLPVPKDVEGAWLQQEFQPLPWLLGVHQPHDAGRQQGQASNRGATELEEGTHWQVGFGLARSPPAGNSKALASAHLDAVHVWLDVAPRFQVQHVHRGEQGLAGAKGGCLHTLQDRPACL